MAVTEQPSGLMDIARLVEDMSHWIVVLRSSSSRGLDMYSSLTQDEIPFKLRCAICNKLAVNAFRLPCCDQAICETCKSYRVFQAPVVS